MEIGEKILVSNIKEIVIIRNIKEEWTSFPHGSGTDYKVYTLERSNGEQFEYNELDEIRNKLVSANYLSCKNNSLQNDIKNIIKQIEENNKLIEKLS